MKKIRFFFLQAIFLLTPLIYAWLYIPGIGFDLARVVTFIFPNISWSWFESVKVNFFLICTLGALCSHLFLVFFWDRLPHISRFFIISLGVIFVWTIASLWINHDVNIYFTSGNPEKRHGWFFYMALFILFFLLKSVSSEERRKLLYTSFAGFIGVIVYVVFQKIWLDPLAPFYETRLDPRRAFSTLGNPNYLAGFVLIMLPLLHETIFAHKGEHKDLWGIILWVVAAVVIYLTGSYLAWIIFAGYVLVILLTHIVSKKKHRDIFWISLVVIAFLAGILFWQEYGRDVLEMQKMKWFIARWYLWKTGVAWLLHDPWHFLFWYGPDGFLAVSEYFRHPLLSVYEDPAYRIDRSHNVFIDFALHFGVPITVALLVLIGRQIPHISHGKRVSLLLFALYFSFNIPVLIHFLIVMQILTSPQTHNAHHW
jgi:hypothetical protein